MACVLRRTGTGESVILQERGREGVLLVVAGRLFLLHRSRRDGCRGAGAGEGGEKFSAPGGGGFIVVHVALHAVQHALRAEFREAFVELASREAKRLAIVLVTQRDDAIAQAIELRRTAVLIERLPKLHGIVRHVALAPGARHQEKILLRGEIAWLQRIQPGGARGESVSRRLFHQSLGQRFTVSTLTAKSH